MTVPGPGEAGERELRAQAQQIHRVCRELQLSLVRIVPDVEGDGRSPLDRSGAAQLVRRLAQGEATCIVVTELRRLIASADDWRLLRKRVNTDVVRLVVVDIDLDTSAEPDVWADGVR